jgi:hypothetical protein
VKAVFRCTMVFSILVLLAAGHVWCLDDAQGVVALRNMHLTAAGTYLGALSGQDVAKLAVGMPVNLDDLAGDRRLQIWQAATMVMDPQEYSKDFGSLPEGVHWELKILTSFQVSLESSALGTDDLVLRLERFNPDLAIVPKADSTAVLPTVPQPPSIETLTSSAPADPSARASFMSGQLTQVLKPVVDYRLSKASSVPFGTADFLAGKTLELAALDDNQRAWLSQLYAQMCVQATRLAGTVKTPSTGKIAVEGVPTNWLEKAPPAWSTLADAKVKLSLHYCLGILPSSGPTCDKGVAWEIPIVQ